MKIFRIYRKIHLDMTLYVTSELSSQIILCKSVKCILLLLIETNIRFLVENRNLVDSYTYEVIAILTYNITNYINNITIIL